MFSLPAGLHHRLQAIAAQRGMSMAAYIRETLEENLDTAAPLRIAEGRVAYTAVEEPPKEMEEMKRLVISLPDGLHARLRERGRNSGISMAAYIRGVLEERTGRERPKPSFGAFASGYTDTARLAGELKYGPRSWR
jgi:predicted HicB family RNase H-like nuclease